MQLADKTRLFIRDSLYRLARSARTRQATGVSGTQASDEDSEYELEPSTSGGQPSSSANTPRFCAFLWQGLGFGVYGKFDGISHHHKGKKWLWWEVSKDQYIRVASLLSACQFCAGLRR